MDSLESIPGLLKSLKIRAQDYIETLALVVMRSKPLACTVDITFLTTSFCKFCEQSVECVEPIPKVIHLWQMKPISCPHTCNDQEKANGFSSFFAGPEGAFSLFFLTRVRAFLAVTHR